MRRLQLGPEPAREADRHELAERAQSADGGLEQLAADRIDDDVDPQVVRQLVVDVRLLGAELAAELELLGRPHGRDDPRVERAGDLDRRAADAAGRGVHEHRRVRRRSRTCRVSGTYAVRNVRMKPAPSANDAPSGSGTSEARGTAASSAYAPAGPSP